MQGCDSSEGLFRRSGFIGGDNHEWSPLVLSTPLLESKGQKILKCTHAPYFWAKEGSRGAFLMRDILKNRDSMITGDGKAYDIFLAHEICYDICSIGHSLAAYQRVDFLQS